MLHDFLRENRGEILARARVLVAERQVSAPSETELQNGLPHFFDQLVTTLLLARDQRGAEQERINASATLHGGEMQRTGLTVAQVVNDYGSICQAVTELADKYDILISADEFHTFNRCLDEAIAQAVTEFQLRREVMSRDRSVADLGFLAHEMRNLLSTSMLTYDALARGNVGVRGSTSALLGRSLRRMGILIERSLAEVRLGAGIEHSERVPIAALFEEVEIAGTLAAKDRDIHLTIETVPSDLAAMADAHVLSSIVANLVQNAFKFTRAHGRITLRTHMTTERVQIEVEDQCGGLPPGKAADLFQPYQQRGENKTGLGLGLAISIKGARACGGDIRVRDLPGQGCVFTVDLPRAAAPTS